MSDQVKFPRLEWHESVDAVARCVVSIETPESMGTGFVISIVHQKTKAASRFMDQ